MKRFLRASVLSVLAASAFGTSVYWLAREGERRTVERLVGMFSTASDAGGRWSSLVLQPDGVFLHSRGRTEGQRAVFSDELSGLWRREGAALELRWSDGRIESVEVSGLGTNQLELVLGGARYRELAPFDCY